MDTMGRSGVLLARAWQEPNARDGVRIRVMWSAVPIPGDSTTESGVVVVETGDDLCAVITDWLARIAETPQPPDVS